jgi:para-nitrobenzyl esterase
MEAAMLLDPAKCPLTTVRLPAFARFRAFHGAEIPFVFNNLHKGRVPFNEREKGLANAMSDYWVQFAKTGNPNRQGLVAWPTYDSNTDQHLEFGDEIKTGQELRKEKCDLFDKFSASQSRRELKKGDVDGEKEN